MMEHKKAVRFLNRILTAFCIIMIFYPYAV